MRLIVLSCLSATILLGQTPAALAADGDLPFVGKWDCDINVLTFTNDTYHDGTNEYPLNDVAEAGGEFVITLAPDYVIGLSDVEADKMTFAPMAGGDEFMCFRLE